MVSEQKVKLLNFIDSEIVRVTESADKVKVTLSHSLSGYSIAGEMFHAQNTQGMVNQYLERLKKLKSEVEKASDGVSEDVRPVCSVNVRYEDGNILGFYFVKEAVSLPGYLLISVDSPFGKAIIGKKEGDMFKYAIVQDGVNKSFKGNILKIE